MSLVRSVVVSPDGIVEQGGAPWSKVTAGDPGKNGQIRRAPGP